MKRYPKYKDSGVEWLGYLPEHWKVKKLKFVATIQPSNVDKKTFDNEIPVLLCNYSDVYKNKWITNEIDFMEATATQEEIRKFSIIKGDIIITKDSESKYDIAVPALVNENLKNVICGYHLTQIRPKNLDGNFLFHLFQCKRFNGQFVVNANGVTRFGLPSRSINDAFIGFPPLSEQNAIACFIDRKLVQIDQFISNKQRFIELLKEQKSAIVNRAVTKGLNPDTPMKPSGIEWLGDIPQGWEIMPIKHTCSRIVDCKNRTPLYLDDGIYPVIRTSNVRNGCLILDNLFYTDEAHYREWTKRGAPQIGDVLFTREAPAGEACIITESKLMCMGQRMMYFRPDSSQLSSDFLLYSIYGPLISNYVNYTCSGSTVGHLRLAQVYKLPILIPPRNEQNKITNFLNQESEKIDLAITKAEKEIELIQEYRTTLISDAVTGKIDVRELTHNS